jgi:hypothetical protein
VVTEAEVDARNAMNFHRSTSNCFTDGQLLEYRVRQRQHGARVICEQLIAAMRSNPLDLSGPQLDGLLGLIRQL